MKIAVFGATGGIGSWGVKFALENGCQVVAYVRNPSKLDIEDPALTVVQSKFRQRKN